MTVPKKFKELQNRLLLGAINTKIYDLVRETPLTPAPLLSALCGNRVLLKREDLQSIFSFKIRGAYHKMANIPPPRLSHGVVAASAGNHAQGVAVAAQKIGASAVIFMPKHTQRIKVNAVRARGAKVVLEGGGFDDADKLGRRFARENGGTYIPPFDDADIIAGNATVAAEILRHHPGRLKAIFCAIGGGGLIGGVAAYIKALRPEILVIGVEAEESASMTKSLTAGKPMSLSQVGIFADAVAVKKPGKLTFHLARHFVDDILTVNNDAICAAVKDMYDDTRVIFEPSGALAAAGLKEYVARHQWRGETLVALACGANMNFDRLRFIAERAEIGENREALLAVTIPERPGSFRKFCALLGGRSITEFNYRMADSEVAHIFVGVEIQDAAERALLINKLRAAKLPTLDLTDNEMAKLHMRHMVGGRAAADNEVLYRFEFPERPGAMMNFLTTMGSPGRRWNISLFHYRNHGSDTGRVLVGVQVPAAENKEFETFLKTLSHPFICESDNPAYQLFLCG